MTTQLDPADAYDTLIDLVRRIESEEDDMRAIKEAIKEIYHEAKSAGFDTKILRKVVMKRRQDADKRHAIEEQIERYENALEQGLTNRSRKTAAE